MDDLCFYRELARANDDRQALADDLLPRVCDELGIDPPRVHWIVACHPDDATFRARSMYGAARPGQVFIRHDLAIETIAEVLMHECRHIQQMRRYPDHQHDSDEFDALRYGETASSRPEVQQHVSRADYIERGVRRVETR